MDSTTEILFTDTNGFLHVRDLKDIPWRDLFPAATAIDVMIAPCVIEELDKHKANTNQRRRNRARAALNAIDKASRSSDYTLVLRDAPVRVRLILSRAPRLDWAAHPNLDPANPDDRLVAEALSFGNGAGVFSNDTGPRIRARLAGILAYEPLDAWLLPIEQSDDQRRITKLEQDVQRLANRAPKIVAGFDAIDSATSEIRVIRPILQPLDPAVVEILTTAHLHRHPRADPKPTTGGRGLVGFGISDGDIRRYHEAYATFETKVRECCSILHKLINRVGVAPEVRYFVRNEGSVAAEGLRIEFDLEGTGYLFADRANAEHYIGSLAPPEPPELPRERGAIPLNIPTLHDAMKPRDPVAFYWFDRPVGAGHGALQCQDFRATRQYAGSIYVLHPHEGEELLTLHVSATNLSTPLRLAAKLVFVEEAAEWSDPVVQQMLPPWLDALKQ